jgi:hypothetical protein
MTHLKATVLPSWRKMAGNNASRFVAFTGAKNRRNPKLHRQREHQLTTPAGMGWTETRMEGLAHKHLLTVNCENSGARTRLIRLLTQHPQLIHLMIENTGVGGLRLINY